MLCRFHDAHNFPAVPAISVLAVLHRATHTLHPDDSNMNIGDTRYMVAWTHIQVMMDAESDVPWPRILDECRALLDDPDTPQWYRVHCHLTFARGQMILDSSNTLTWLHFGHARLAYSDLQQRMRIARSTNYQIDAMLEPLHLGIEAVAIELAVRNVAMVPQYCYVAISFYHLLIVVQQRYTTYHMDDVASRTGQTRWM